MKVNSTFFHPGNNSEDALAGDDASFESGPEPLAASSRISNSESEILVVKKEVSSARQKRPRLLIQGQQRIYEMMSAERPMIAEGTKKERDLTNAVAQFICKASLPLYMVEKESFIDLLKSFEPRLVSI